MNRTADDRLNDIENQLRTSATRLDNMSGTLDQINNLLRTLGTGHAPQPDNTPQPIVTEDDEEFVLPPSAPQPIPDSGSGTRVNDRVRPNRPTAFDGDRANGRAFLNSCVLYMSICKAEFKNDEIRINWMLSYMSLGRAAKFSARVLRHLANTGSPMFADLRSFMENFVANFCPVDEEMTAALTLNDDTYYQGKRSVDEYVDEFTDLLEEAGMTDGLQVVIMFKKGLDPAIRTRIAEMVDGRPKDKVLQEWVAAARRVEKNTQADRKFASVVGRSAKSASHPTHTTRAPITPVATPISRGVWRFPTASTAPTATAPTRPAAPALHPGVPMDIDAARRKAKDPLVCRRCGKTGHWSRECPSQFDVRYMTVEERDEWAMEMLARLDTAPETPVEESEESEPTAEPVKEDF